MIAQLACQILKLGFVTGTGIVGLAAVTPDTQHSWVVGLERMGSFFLVAVFVIGTLWLASKSMPILLGMFERTKDQFVQELMAERVAREKATEVFRQTIHEDRKETVAAIKEQTEYVARLVKNLEERPCQK